MKLPQILTLTTATLLFSLTSVFLPENTIFSSPVIAQTTQTNREKREIEGEDLGKIGQKIPFTKGDLGGSKIAQTTETEAKQAEADRLLDQGVEQYNISEYQLAVESWQKALKLYQEIGDRNGMASSLTNVGLVYGNLGEYNKAIDYHQQSLSIFQEIGNRNGVSYSLNNIGIIYNNLGEYSKAIEYYQQSLAIVREIGDQNGEAKSLNNLGNIYSYKTIELEQITAIQNDLKSLEQNAVLLYSVIFDDRLELILITPNSPPIRKTIQVSKQDLNSAILYFRQVLTNPNQDALTIAQKFYDKFFQPIAEEIEKANADTIIYAPDAQFRYIPLSALHDGEKWLAEKYQINHITALALTDFKGKSPRKNNVLAGAFVNGNYQFTIGENNYDFKGLKGAEKEVKNISQILPNSLLIDQQFNPNNILPKMSNYSIVHLATHGAFVIGKPEESFILFGDGSRNNLREVERNWNLTNVDLIVLSACETAINGEIGKGQEILGFGYLMQLVGAKASLSSLWTVSDAGTELLMTQFYRNLKDKNLSVNEALQQAQINLINGENSEFSHPYYWSPFILIGNGF